MTTMYNLICESVIVSELNVKNMLTGAKNHLRAYGNHVKNTVGYGKFMTGAINRGNDLYGSNKPVAHVKNIGDRIGDLFGKANFAQAKNETNPQWRKKAMTAGVRNAALSTAATAGLAYGGYKAIKAIKNRRAAAKKKKEEDAAK